MARILVVEDDAENRALLLTMLEKLGYEAAGVSDGVTALRALGLEPGDLGSDPDLPAEPMPAPDGPWDAVLMDVVLPGPDGRDVTRRMRELDDALPVVAVTGQAMSGDRESCLASGMNAYVPKPFTVDLIRDALEACLGGR